MKLPGISAAVLKMKSPGCSGAFLDFAWNKAIEIVHAVGVEPPLQVGPCRAPDRSLPGSVGEGRGRGLETWEPEYPPNGPSRAHSKRTSNGRNRPSADIGAPQKEEARRMAGLLDHTATSSAQSAPSCAGVRAARSDIESRCLVPLLSPPVDGRRESPRPGGRRGLDRQHRQVFRSLGLTVGDLTDWRSPSRGNPRTRRSPISVAASPSLLQPGSWLGCRFPPDRSHTALANPPGI